MGLQYLLLALLPCTVAFGQQAGSAKPASDAIALIQQALAQEQVQLHLSQPYFAAGERVWYTANFKGAGSNDESRILYVSLQSSTGQFLVQQRLILTNGIANGDFILPEAWPSGNYTLKAYTNWMRNYSEPQQYRKNLLIVNPHEIAAIEKVAPATKSMDLTVHFVPQGHTLVADIPSKIAVIVTNAAGIGVAATGVIEDEKGNAVANFSTGPEGAGNVMLKPEKGKLYFAQVRAAGYTGQRLALPAVKQKGSTLAINEQSATGIKVEVRNTEAATYTLAAIAGNKVYFTQTSAQPVASETVTIPWPEAQHQPVKVLLLNDQKKVVAEHAADKPVSESITVKTTHQKYNPRQEVKVTLQHSGAGQANLAVAVVPALLAATEPSASQLLATHPDTVLWRTIELAQAPVKYKRETIVAALGQAGEMLQTASVKINAKTDTAFVHALPAEVKMYALQASARKRIANAYSLSEPHAQPTLAKLPADKIFKLDDFVDFESMEEAIKGATTNVKLSKKQGKYKINLLYTSPTTKYVIKKEPLYILDGVVLNSAEEIFALPLNDLATFEIAWQENTLNEANIGELAGNGIFAVYTKSGAAGERLKQKGLPVIYGQYNKPLHFVVTSYAGDAAVPSQVPDLKSLVFWQPHLQTSINGDATFTFSLPDNTGNYKIIVTGFTPEGKLLKCTTSITSSLQL